MQFSHDDQQRKWLVLYLTRFHNAVQHQEMSLVIHQESKSEQGHLHNSNFSIFLIQLV